MRRRSTFFIFWRIQALFRSRDMWEKRPFPPHGSLASSFASAACESRLSSLAEDFAFSAATRGVLIARVAPTSKLSAQPRARRVIVLKYVSWLVQVIFSLSCEAPKLKVLC